MTVPFARSALLLSLAVAVASCATPPAPTSTAAAVPLDRARSTLPQSSPECLAQKLPAGAPFPASAIPEAAMKGRIDGWVAMQYDMVAGAARNIVVVDSRPAGLYDAAALKHAAGYRDPGGSTVRGCIMTVEVKF